MKWIIEVLLIVALVAQIAKSNVIGNKELETKIHTMWEKVNKQLERFDAKSMFNEDSSTDEAYKKSVQNVISKMRTRYNEYFTNIEEEARKSGKLLHVDIDTPFLIIAKDFLDELMQKINEHIMKLKDLDSSKKTQLVKAIEHFYVALKNCIQDLIDESTTNPTNIFVDYEEKYLKDQLERLKGIGNKCKKNIILGQTEMNAKIHSLNIPKNIRNNYSPFIF